MLEELKLLANKRDVRYQSLLKIFLSEKIDDEFHKHAPKDGVLRYKAKIRGCDMLVINHISTPD